MKYFTLQSISRLSYGIWHCRNILAVSHYHQICKIVRTEYKPLKRNTNIESI